MKWILTNLEIKGVKGVLDQSGNFDLPKGKSIAIYAPNGSGKSGYADAVEYLFSLDGSVEHFGKGGVDSEHGGRHAIRHVLAEQKGIESTISATLFETECKIPLNITRFVKTTQGDFLPKELESIVKSAPAHRILRSQDLSRFVTNMNPGEKYTELAKWLGLEHLEKIMTHLTIAENKLSEENHSAEIGERLMDISNHTKGEATTSALALPWCTKEVTKYLGSEIQVKSVKEIETCINALNEEYKKSATTTSQSNLILEAKSNLQRLLALTLSDSGHFVSCSKDLNDMNEVTVKIQTLVSHAKDSVFQEVWEATKNILDTQSMEKCPTCFTPWKDTVAKSQDNAKVKISESLSSLNELRDAQNNQNEIRNKVIITIKQLRDVLRQAKASAKMLSNDGIESNASEISDALNVLVESNPSAEDLFSKGSSILEDAKKRITEKTLSEVQAITVENASTRTEEIRLLNSDLVAIRDSLQRITELNTLQDEYTKVQQKFSAISTAIRDKISEVVNNTISSLRSEMIATYQKIDTSGAVPDIHIEPNAAEKSLILRIDFHSAGRRPPSGYLSESRVNALGLALFVTSIKSFNKTFPFVFLDDIVSSYDADNRARIVDIIAEDLADCQIFLTTHDDRFYQMLKARLEDKGWIFHRIKGWTLDGGPKRIEDLLRPDEIDNLISAGDPRIAGNAVRQFMEEWLDKMCAKYEAYTLHKRLQKEFDRTLFDFWEPFNNRIEEIKGGFLERLKKQTCYDRLKTSGLLNYYSHAQASPYEWDALGDVEYIWKEFRDFQALFNCNSCKKLLQYDHDSSRLYCVCGGVIFPD